MLTEVQPWTVVAGHDHQGIGGDLLLVQGLQHFSDRPVDLHDHIAKKSQLAFSAEARRSRQWHMGHGMREVKKERTFFIRFDKVDRALGVRCGQLRLIL